MVENIDSKRTIPTASTAILPPDRFEVGEGKSIILAADIPHSTEPVGWTRDGIVINNDGKTPSRFRTFERLLNGESAADYRALSGHSAPTTVRACLAIDSTLQQDSGSYELLVRARTNPSNVIACAVASVRVTSQLDAKKRKVDAEGALSSELPSVHYPHPMAPVFIRSLPDKVYIDAGDTVQLGCRLWGLPNNFVNWTTDSPGLLKKASVA